MVEPALSPDDRDGLYVRFLFQYPGSEQSAFSLDVDLVIPGSGITAIFGQSGSGKTTLLRCLAGLEQPAQGHLTFNGEIWQNDTLFVPTHKRPLGYVFQESSLFPHLTAQGNLNYAMKRSGASHSKDFYDRVVALMGIEPILQRYPDRLSGGERQRVAIARALLIHPRVLLMDEPLASLDVARKQEILPYLEKLRFSFDIPILYVSHAMDEVARLADHVIILEQGRALAQGRLSDVISRIDLPLPAGSDAGVVWQGQIVERNQRWHLARVACAGGELWMPDDSDMADDRIRIRILARDVSLALDCHTDTSILNRLPVEVVDIGADGDQAMVLVRLRTRDDYLIAWLTRRSADHLKLKQGQRLWAQIKSIAIVR